MAHLCIPPKVCGRKSPKALSERETVRSLILYITHMLAIYVMKHD
jgi:hypothetical protein